jgi:hypothetical protein
MPTNWVKVATDVGVGAVVGAASGAAERMDENAGRTEFLKRAGNYIDYGVPILAIIGSLVGILKGDWETRALTIGATLAGRRVTREYIYKPTTVPASGKWTKYDKPTTVWTKYDKPPEDQPPAQQRAAVGLEF